MDNISNTNPDKGEKSESTDKKQFIDDLLAGNSMACLAYAQDHYQQNSEIKKLYEEVFKSSMYKVGVLWEGNKISVATEHMASAIVESILNQFYPKILTPHKKNRTVVATCVENEQHQIGIKMISDVFEMNGWNALFLGANTPLDELCHFIRLQKPDLLALSLTIYFNLPRLLKMIERIHTDFPELTILVGGQAFRHGGTEQLSTYSNVIYMASMEETDHFIKKFG